LPLIAALQSAKISDISFPYHANDNKKHTAFLILCVL
jgi:hypothetical protein